MATLLGNLRVRLTAETEDFRRGLESARQNLGSLQKDLNKFRQNTLANVASFGALGLALKSSLDVANQYDNAQRQLAATSKLTGVELGFLQQTSKDAQAQFRLSAVAANEFTIEMSKLASKAGDVSKSSSGLQAFLDIGAARGLSASETLKAVQQSILGIDEGTDKLFSKNPSVLYEEFAAKIHTTAGKLTDQQKAQALLDAAMQDGAKVRGEYQKWLETSQGQQYLLTQSMEQTQAVVGKALQPALVAILPIISTMATGVQMAVRGWQMLGATLGMVPGLFEAAKKALHGDLKGAKKQVEDTTAAWREVIAEIQGAGKIEVPSFKAPATGKVKPAAKETAKKFFDSLEEEWENLRHSITLIGLEVTGSDTSRSAEEEAHQLRLIDIEKQHILARHKLKELTDYERDESLRQLEIKRQIVTATRVQTDAARQANTSLLASLERQSLYLTDALDKEKLSNQLALERLGAEGSLGERLKLQLDLVERTYQLQREALLSDVRLTDDQLENELLKLDLAKERERLQLRMNAAVQKELAAKEKQKSLHDDLRGTAAGLVSSAFAGNLSGSQVGSSLFSLGAKQLGGMFAGPVGMAVAGGIGSLVGGLFGRKSKRDEVQQPVIKGLDAIERAQRDTISAIAAQTDALLNPENRLLNLPSDFRVPSYQPGPSGMVGPRVTYGDTNITLNITVPQGHSANDIRDIAQEAVANAIERGRRSSAWN